MGSYSLDIVLKHVHILKDGIVDPLQHIVRRITGCGHLVSVIDKSVAERLDFTDFALNREISQYGIQFVHY